MNSCIASILEYRVQPSSKLLPEYINRIIFCSVELQTEFIFKLDNHVDEGKGGSGKDITSDTDSRDGLL